MVAAFQLAVQQHTVLPVVYCDENGRRATSVLVPVLVVRYILREFQRAAGVDPAGYFYVEQTCNRLSWRECLLL
jgi:hypothetical protein